jgi:uncharacterized protein YecT (DUF1311 family)
MSKMAGYIFCFLFLFETGSSFAKNICEENTTQQRNECMRGYSKAADQALNFEYKALKNKISTSFPADDPELPSLLKSITEAQRAWVKYRDLNCNVKSSLADDASPTHEMLTNKCIGRMSHIRAQELHEIAKEY